jgi:hypothetical protein
MMVWIMGLGVGGAILGLTTGIMDFIGFNKAYSVSQSNEISASDVTSGGNIHKYYGTYMTEKSAKDSAVIIALAMVWEDWMYAQYMSMDEDTEMRVKKQMNEGKEEMLSLFSF